MNKKYLIDGAEIFSHYGKKFDLELVLATSAFLGSFIVIGAVLYYTPFFLNL